MKGNLELKKKRECKVNIRRSPPLNMSAKELAIYLGISERKIRADAAVGKIPSVRIGGRIIFRLYDIDKFLDKSLRSLAQ